MRTYSLKRGMIFTLLLVCSLLFSIPCFAHTIQIQLDGKTLTTNVAPISKNGTTLVPIRLISENLGAKVDYDAVTKKISITSNATSIELFVHSTTAHINGKPTHLTMAPEIVSNTTMVPIRFISENLNCKVEWDQASQVVKITSISTNLASSLPVAILKVKDYGTITLELYPEMAPNTVNNFIFLANNGFYDGLIFHRVIADFMIQGGDPSGTGAGGPSYSIAGEFASNGFITNTLSHTKGIISMARTSDPDSAGSQFFITSADSTFLDGEYAAFGKVISGLDVVDAISVVKTNSQDAPLTPIQIESIVVDTKDKTYPNPLGYMAQ